MGAEREREREKEQGGILFYYGYCRALDAGYNFRMHEQYA